MSFTPVIPMGGYAGWRFLNRTMDEQSASLAATPAMERDMEYFRENISAVETAEDLVGDYRLLKVALTAFGLQDDLPNKAFIRRVLEDGVIEADALSNRLADKSYRAFSEAFGFGSGLPPLSRVSGFADKILGKFESQSFEQAVGDVNSDMRLALNATRELPELAAEGGSETTLWYRIMGDEPLRSMMETAFGLPSSFGALDVDQQLLVFQDRADSLFGDSSVSQFADPERMDDLVRTYMVRAQLSQSSVSTSSASIALALLQGAG